MCPVLAVSNTARNALAMGLATLFVLVLSNAVVSSLRASCPSRCASPPTSWSSPPSSPSSTMLIQAASLELHRALGAFISLIVVNCMILGRAEAFASKNRWARAARRARAWARLHLRALLPRRGARGARQRARCSASRSCRRCLPAVGDDDPAGRRVLHARRLAAAVRRERALARRGDRRGRASRGTPAEQELGRGGTARDEPGTEAALERSSSARA
jgi:hypothetical protein